MARRPSVALWGQGGPAAAQAAACAALGWKVEALVRRAPTSEASAAQVTTATISPDELALRPDIDLVIMTDRPGTVTGGDSPGASAIGAVLDSGHHLVLAPPLADTLVEADAIVEAVRSAASSGFTVLAVS